LPRAFNGAQTAGGSLKLAATASSGLAVNLFRFIRRDVYGIGQHRDLGGRRNLCDHGMAGR
jgi:hypothetical protein